MNPLTTSAAKAARINADAVRYDKRRRWRPAPPRGGKYCLNSPDPETRLGFIAPSQRRGGLSLTEIGALLALRVLGASPRTEGKRPATQRSGRRKTLHLVFTRRAGVCNAASSRSERPLLAALGRTRR